MMIMPLLPQHMRQLLLLLLGRSLLQRHWPTDPAAITTPSSPGWLPKQPHILFFILLLLLLLLLISFPLALNRIPCLVLSVLLTLPFKLPVLPLLLVLLLAVLLVLCVIVVPWLRVVSVIVSVWLLLRQWRPAPSECTVLG